MDSSSAWPPAPSSAPSQPRPWRFHSGDLMQRIPEGQRARIGSPAIWFLVWPALILITGLVSGVVAALVYGFQVGMAGLENPDPTGLMFYMHPMIALANLVLLLVFWAWSSRRGMAGAVMDPLPRSWWRETGFGLILFIATVYAGGTLVTWIMELIQQPVVAQDIVPTEAGIALYLIAIPGIVIIGPVMEEIIFRGWMLPAMKQRGMGWIGALLVSSLIFGLLHIFAGPASVAYTFILGLAAGITRMLSGRLWGAVLLHVLNNLMAITLPQIIAPAPV